MDEELSYILQTYRINNLHHQLKQSRNATLREVEKLHLSSDYSKYYKHLTDFTLIRQYAELHAIDLDMFHYPVSPFSKNKHT